MDAEGDVIGQPQGRSVDDFETTLAALERWQKLAAKQDRTPAEDVDLFLAELDLGKLSFDDAKARVDKLEGMSDAQKQHVDNEMILLEADAILKEAGRNKEQQQEAAAKLAAMAKAGKAPTGKRAAMFWSAVMAHADTTSDPELFATALEAIRAEYGSDPNAAKYFEAREKRLEELKQAAKDVPSDQPKDDGDK